MKRDEIKPNTVYRVFRWGVSGTAVYAHTGDTVEIVDVERAAGWQRIARVEKHVRLHVLDDGDPRPAYIISRPEPPEELVAAPRSIAREICSLDQFPAVIAQFNRSKAERDADFYAQKAAQAERSERFTAALTAAGYKDAFDYDTNHFAQFRAEAQDLILDALAAHQPVTS